MKKAKGKKGKKGKKDAAAGAGGGSGASKELKGAQTAFAALTTALQKLFEKLQKACSKRAAGEVEVEWLVRIILVRLTGTTASFGLCSFVSLPVCVCACVGVCVSVP